MVRDVDVATPTLDPGPFRDPVASEPLEARWLGRIAYRDAWALQHELVEQRIAGRIPDQLLLLEHPAVLTLGRHAGDGHVRASAEELAARGIELIRVERGGESGGWWVSAWRRCIVVVNLATWSRARARSSMRSSGRSSS